MGNAEVEKLRRQLEDARALAVRSGYFQSGLDDLRAEAALTEMVRITEELGLYDDGGPVCLPCRNGDHSAHSPTLADVCVGCACEVMR